jgi:hypothetical protein
MGLFWARLLLFLGSDFGLDLAIARFGDLAIESFKPQTIFNHSIAQSLNPSYHR